MSIVSQNGETLHNHYHGNVLESGRLLLVDAGAETNMNYCSDFTRTIPVNGKFTVRQKDIYDIVLAANSRTFELARPGAFYWQMHNAAARIIADGLKELGLMQGDMEAAVACGAQALFSRTGSGTKWDSTYTTWKTLVRNTSGTTTKRCAARRQDYHRSAWASASLQAW